MTEDLRNVVNGVAERVVLEDLSSTSHGAEHLARYLFAAQWAPGRRVVDLCCGTGYGSGLLLAAGATAVHGIDISASAIAEAERGASRPGASFSVQDVTTRLDVDDADLRVCFEGLEHVADPDGLLDNLSRRLPSKTAIVSTPNAARHPSGHSGNPHHVHEYRREEFQSMLSSHFARVRMFFQWRYPDPHDIEWTARQALRAFVPVTVKHGFRRRSVRSQARHAGRTAAADGHVDAINHRPLPTTYLQLPPGLRFGEPSIWIAVCQTRS